MAIDARIQEIYYGQYQINQGIMTLLGDEQVAKPSELVVSPHIIWSGVGNAWEVYANEISYKPLNINTSSLPTATAIALIAKEKYLNGSVLLDSAEALPVYLRDKVAKKK